MEYVQDATPAQVLPLLPLLLFQDQVERLHINNMHIIIAFNSML